MLYLIFSHDHQGQLARLARAIRRLSPDSLIAIHHDPAKGDIDPDLFAGIPSLHFVPEPVRGAWGDYSQVEQYLHALGWCFANLRWDWICTLTGESYPLSSLRDFENRLEVSGYDAFMRHFDALDPATWKNGVWPQGEGERRYHFKYFSIPRFRYYYKVPRGLLNLLGEACKSLNTAQPLIKIIAIPGGRIRFGVRRFRSPLPLDFKLCGGRQAWQINRDACTYLLEFVESNPKYVAFFKQCLLPDEGFFTSILANASSLRVCNDALRYIKWPKGIGAARGAVISSAELEDALNSGKPFGLKFNDRIEPGVLDRLDVALGLTGPTPNSFN
jgi:hypothetical protein